MKTTAQKYRDIESSFEINIIKYILTNHSIGEYVELDLLIDEIKTGKTPSKADNKNYEDRYLKWYKPSDIGNSMYLSETESFVSKYAYNNRSITIFEKDTLLITCIGDIGRMGIVQEQCTSNQQITGITFNNKISVEYIYLYLLVNRRLFYNDVSQTTLPIINQQKLKKIQIKLVDYEEQLRLVKLYKTLQRDGNLEILKTLGYNSDIQLKSKILATLHNNHNKVKSSIGSNLQTLTSLRQQILQDAITGKLSEKWRRDNPNIESADVLLEKIKAEKEKLVREGKIKKRKILPPITENEIPFALPEGWAWCRLGELGETTTGTTPKTTDPENFGNYIPFIKPGDISEEGVNYDNEKLSPKGLSAGRYLSAGSILMVCIGGSTGKSALISRDISFNQQINALTPLRIVNNYVYFTFISKYFYNKVRLLSSGSATPIINKSKWESISFPLPPHAEQQYIVERIESLFAKLDRIKELDTEDQTNIDLLNQVVLKEMFEE